MALTGWTKKFELQIDSSNIDSNLSDFPVYIDENVPGLPSDFFSTSESNGGDIRASSDSAGNTQLPLEIENFDTTNSKCSIWVKVPSVNSSSNTSFYIWYDKDGESQPAEDSTYGSENVWNSNYKAVFHMTGTGGLTDSTSNDVDMTEEGTVPEADGKLGKCREEDADFNYFENTTSSVLNDLLVNGGTLSTWFWLDSAASGTNVPGLFMGGWGEPFQVYLNGTNNSIIANYYDGSDQIETQSNNNAFSDATWVHLAVRLRNTSGSDYQLEMFVNGQELSSYSSQGTGSNAVTGSADIRLGANNWADWPYTFEGKIDQVTANNTTLSNAWIKAEYTNQNDTTDFFATIASNNEAQLNINLPSLSISISGEQEQENEISLSVNLPSLETQVNGTQTNESSLGVNLPSLQVEITGDQENQGTLTSMLPSLEAQINGAQINESSLDVNLPSLQVEITGEQENEISLSVNLPSLEAQVNGTQTNESSLDVNLPSLQVEIMGEQENEGSLSVTLPSLDVSFSSTSSYDIDLDINLPSIAVDFNLTRILDISGVLVPGENKVYPGSLSYIITPITGEKIDNEEKINSGSLSLGVLSIVGSKILDEDIVYTGNLGYDLSIVSGIKLVPESIVHNGSFFMGSKNLNGVKIGDHDIFYKGRIFFAEDVSIFGEIIRNKGIINRGLFTEGEIGVVMPDLVTRQEVIDHLRLDDDYISAEIADLNLKISGASAAVLTYLEMDIEDWGDFDSDGEYINNVAYDVKLATLFLIGDMHRYRDAGSPNYKNIGLPDAVKALLHPHKTFGLDIMDNAD